MLKHENPSVSPARHPVRALVLAPRASWPIRWPRTSRKYAKHTHLRSTVVFGGIDMKPQTLQLKAGVEVLIATPGRLLDHIEAKNCVLNQVEYVVLDEADRMLDIGFLPDLQRILSYLPKARQTLLFSATFSPEIKRWHRAICRTPSWSRRHGPTRRPPRLSSALRRLGRRQARRDPPDLARSVHPPGHRLRNSKLGVARLARSL